MKIEINGLPWVIVEVDPESEHLIVDGCLCVGSCNYLKGVISLANNHTLDTLRRTLIHELAHAVHYSSGLYALSTFNTEQVCEFVSHNADLIVNLADRYIKSKV